MPPFNWFDVVLIFILMGSVVSGLRSGLARVVVGLIATAAGICAGFWFYRLVAAQILPYIGDHPDLANLLGFLLIFSAILCLGAIVAAILARIFQWVGLSWFDHLLGGAAGMIRGILVVALLVDLIVAFAPPPAPKFLDHSQILPYTNQFSSWVIAVAPRELKDSFEHQLAERYAGTSAAHLRPGRNAN